MIRNACKVFRHSGICVAVAGATASANLYAVVETAKANHLEPHAYLSLIFTRLPTLSTVEDYEALLPWNVKTELASSAARPSERQNAVL